MNFFALQNDYAADLQRKLDDGCFKELLGETIRSITESAAYNVDDSDGYVETCDILGTGDYDYEAYVIDLQTFSDGTYAAKINVVTDYCITLDYEYLNEDESYWDKEDQEYHWMVWTETVAAFHAYTEMTFTILLDADGTATFVDYIDAPSDINVYFDDLIEVISSEDKGM